MFASARQSVSPIPTFGGLCQARDYRSLPSCDDKGHTSTGLSTNTPDPTPGAMHCAAKNVATVQRCQGSGCDCTHCASAVSPDEQGELGSIQRAALVVQRQRGGGEEQNAADACEQCFESVTPRAKVSMKTNMSAASTATTLLQRFGLDDVVELWDEATEAASAAAKTVTEGVGAAYDLSLIHI